MSSDNYNEDIRNAIAVMNRGGVILYPTDTVWGIGCDATNTEAVKRVFEIKKREDSKALLVLVDSEAKVEFYVREVPEIAWNLIEISDRPMTLIYDDARNLAQNLIAKDGSVAIRITKEPFSKTLCQRFHRAIVSTSANVSGESSPATFAQISQEILSAVDYVCTSRREEKAQQKPSSIIKIGTDGEIKIIRE